MLATGIALMVAGAGLMALEAHVASYGAMGLVGIAAIVSGAVFALTAAGASLAVLVAVSVILVAAAAAGLTFVVRAGLTATHGRVRTGAEGLIGRVGVLKAAPTPVGQVFLDGCLWQARPSWTDDDDEGPLMAGEPVVVEQVKGLTLTVRRAEEWELES
jgi:membrane-bound ClpP family serine protease